MKVTIEYEDKVEVFNHVTDAYVCIRTEEPYQAGEQLALMPETKSFSYGNNVREILKEVRQSIVELQEYITHGSS